MARNTSGLRRGGPGRPKGIPNKANREIRDIARRLLEDPGYLKALKARLLSGKAPTLEPLLYHYAYGKPKESVEVSGENGGPLKVLFGGRYREAGA